MGCNCKNGEKMDDLLENNKSGVKNGKKIGSYTLKVLAFLLMVAALPIINLMIIWFIFRTLVLNKNVDIKPLLLALGNKFKKVDDEDDNDFEDLTEDDVVMLDVDEITNKGK